MIPNSNTRPPARAMFTEAATDGRMPVVSITASAPRPPVASRTLSMAPSPPGNVMSAPSVEVFGKAAVRVAANQHAVRAQMCLADPAMEARAAVKLGVDDDPVAGAQPIGVAGVDDLPEHFMTHDSRIADRNRTAENLEI